MSDVFRLDSDEHYLVVAEREDGCLDFETHGANGSFDRLTRSEVIALRDALTEWIGDQVKLPRVPRVGVAPPEALVGSPTPAPPIRGWREITFDAVGGSEFDETLFRAASDGGPFELNVNHPETGEIKGRFFVTCTEAYATAKGIVRPYRLVEVVEGSSFGPAPSDDAQSYLKGKK